MDQVNGGFMKKLLFLVFVVGSSLFSQGKAEGKPNYYDVSKGVVAAGLVKTAATFGFLGMARFSPQASHAALLGLGALGGSAAGVYGENSLKPVVPLLQEDSKSMLGKGVGVVAGAGLYGLFFAPILKHGLTQKMVGLTIVTSIAPLLPACAMVLSKKVADWCSRLRS